MRTATATADIAVNAIARRNPLVEFFTKLVGPAALTAAGMIGAGAVATRLLAGAWFGFDLGKANAGRNLLLGLTLIFAVALVLNGLRGLL